MPSHATDLTLHGTKTFEPPYDDESAVGAAAAMTAGSLALALSIGDDGTGAPTLRLLNGGLLTDEPHGTAADQPDAGDALPRTPRRRAARTRRKPLAAEQYDEVAEAVAAHDAFFAARRTPRRELPPPRVFGARLVQALSEATAGERPLTQLSPYLSRTVYHRLERHFAASVRGLGTAGSDRRHNVQSVHVSEPSDGVAELAAVVRRGSRMAAIALRLDGVDGRWQCTALQIG